MNGPKMRRSRAAPFSGHGVSKTIFIDVQYSKRQSIKMENLILSTIDSMNTVVEVESH